MIPKASQRGGGQQLATHLLNELDNDRVEIAEVRGAIAQDLHGAFAEWRACATATQCKKYLYSLSVSPDPKQRRLTRAEYDEFIARVEKRLGLEDQPRALVFHVKDGREHAHVVWSRIDTGKMKAVHLFEDRPALQKVAQQFAREHGLVLPKGMQPDGKNPEAKKTRESTWEKQQHDRTGISREQRRAALTAAWREGPGGKAFVRGLEQRGYYLAGGRKGYVVVDRFGEVHLLSRDVEGARAKDIRARLKDFPLKGLPTTEQAKSFAQKRWQALSPAQAFARAAADRKGKMEALHRKRRAKLDERRRQLETDHAREREALAQAHEAQDKGIADDRLQRQPHGLLLFLSRITGLRAFTDLGRKLRDRFRKLEQKRQREALQRRHGREIQEFSRHYSALTQVENYERRSLSSALRREAFVKAARGPQPVKLPVAGPGMTQELDKALSDRAVEKRLETERDRDKPNRER